MLARLQPRAKTDIARSLNQLAAMLKHSSLVMLFSDLLADPEPVLAALRRLRHGGHDVIVFHILDQAEVTVPVRGAGRADRAGDARSEIEVDADGYRRDYLEEIEKFRDDVPAGMPAKPHRLRAAGHEHAVRPGADGVPGEPAELGLADRPPGKMRAAHFLATSGKDSRKGAKTQRNDAEDDTDACSTSASALLCVLFALRAFA